MRQALHFAEGSDIYCGSFRAAASRRPGIIRYRNKYRLSALSRSGRRVWDDVPFSPFPARRVAQAAQKPFTKLDNMKRAAFQHVIGQYDASQLGSDLTGIDDGLGSLS